MSIWDNLSSNGASSGNGETALVAMTPDQMVTCDLNAQELVRADSEALKGSLIFSERIVIAAYTVADYVPDLDNNQYARFWKVQVIPNLVKSLSQDVKARSVIMKSMSSIRNLSIAIQTSAELVKTTKGSKDAIAIAQRNIPIALKKLEECMEEASTLENSAIETFADQTGELFQIIGPEAVKFVKQKADIGSRLEEHYDEQNKLAAELAHRQGVVERFSHLVHVTESQVKGAEKALEETRLRTQQMNALNAQVDETIKSIPVSTAQAVTTTNHHRGGWWLWKRSSTTTQTNTTMVQNPNREAEKNYYESIILSRMQRIKQNENDEAAKQKVAADMNLCLSDYKSKYQTALTELEKCRETFPGKMGSIQKQIDVLHQKLVDIDKTETDVSNKVGHHGNTLIQCLIEVRTFAKSLKEGSSIYSPLVSILSAMKTLVEADVALLSSQDDVNVFLAGNRLLQQVAFLSNYYSINSQAIQASTKANALANAIEFNSSN